MAFLGLKISSKSIRKLHKLPPHLPLLVWAISKQFVMLHTLSHTILDLPFFHGQICYWIFSVTNVCIVHMSLPSWIEIEIRTPFFSSPPFSSQFSMTLEIHRNEAILSSAGLYLPYSWNFSICKTASEFQPVHLQLDLQFRLWQIIDSTFCLIMYTYSNTICKTKKYIWSV